MTEPASKPSLFRQAALENYANTRRFEGSLIVMPYRKMLTRLGLCLILSGVIGWLFFGSIPMQVTGMVIAVNEEGLYNLETALSGVVTYAKLPVEQKVHAGDLLLILANPQLEARAEAYQHLIETLKKRLAELRSEVDSEKKVLDDSYRQGVRALEFKIGILQEDIPLIEDEVRLKRLVAAKGLLHSNSLLESQRALWSRKIELDQAQAELLNQQFLLKKEYRMDEIILLEERLREVVKERALVEADLDYQRLYSPVTGRVLEWFVQPGSFVSKGQLVARLEIEEKSSHKVFYGYLPLENKKINLHAPVEIELANVKTQEYGALIGHVTQISQHAVTPEVLKKTLLDQRLIDYLLQRKEAVYEVQITPERDTSTLSGYRWTSGKGADIQLTSGTVGTFKGSLESVRPIDYLFPVWWFKQKFYEFHSSP